MSRQLPSEEDRAPDGEESPKTPSSPESSHSGDQLSSVISPHYDASKDVVIRMESLTERQMKAVVLSIWGAVLVGLGLLAMGLDFKIGKDQEYFMVDKTVEKVNLAFASLLLTGLLATWVIYVRRVVIANRTGKRWSLRRKKGVELVLAELTLQLINVIFFLIPNAYVLARECAWFGHTVLWSGVVRWTCWNTIFLIFWIQAHNTHPVKGRWARYVERSDGALMDAPWWAHWPKAGMWVVMEGVLLGLTGYLEKQDTSSRVTVPPGTEEECTLWDYDCSFTDPALGLVICVQVCIVAYAAIYLITIRRSFQQLEDRPYKQFRIANFMVRLQVRLRTLAFLFFILCSVIYFFVRIGTCSSFISSWLGFLPMQFVMSCIAGINAFIFMPKKPEQAGILQVWLQEFAFTEKDLPRKQRERASSFPQGSFEHFCIDCEPMFCFETAVKMMYWSYLVYDFDEMKSSPFSSDTALSLYDLEHFELFWEKTLDTKAIVGWNENTVVIAFRGTASLANVKADVQVWRTPYPAGVGNALLGTRPMVHGGFLRAWTANKFNDRLIGRLEHILYGCTEQQANSAGDGKMVNVYVTGHSLGGALAMLCAFDIKQRCPCAMYSANVKVYTFGAPRPGNHAFARLYNETVPDTWHIINNDDVVTRGGKFFVLYKRPGHRVLINKRGDMVVRPSFVESSIRQVPGGGSIRDHLLTQYQKAMMAVVQAQFGSKSFYDGKDGVLSLARERGTRTVLEVAGVSVERLKDSAENGVVVAQGQAPPRDSQKWRRLLLSMRRSSRREGMGEDKGPKQLESVVVAAEEKAGLTAEDGTATDKAPKEPALEEGGGEEKDAVLHRQMRRTCRQKKCGTVCQLVQQARARAGKQHRVGTSSMADEVPGSAHGSEGSSIPVVGIGLLPQPSDSPPESPHAPVTSTRGNVSEQPHFNLVVDPAASGSLSTLESVAEGGEEAAAAAVAVAEGDAGDAGDAGDVGDAGDAGPATPPRLVVAGHREGAPGAGGSAPQ